MEQVTAAAASPARPFEYIGDKAMTAPDTDPRMIRWAMNPGVEGSLAEPRQLGFGDFVKHAEIFPLVSFKSAVENCTTDMNEPRMNIVIIPAVDIEATLKERFGSRGLVVFCLGEQDEELMARYNDILLPKLPDVGIRCPETDEYDFGARDKCAHCYFDYLQSDECRERIADAAKAGMVRGPEVEQLRLQFLAGFGKFLQSAREEWAQILADVEGGQQNPRITELQHRIRKAIHEVKPSDRQLSLVRELSRAQGEQSTDALLTMVAAMQEDSKARDAQNQQMMGMFATLLERMVPQAAPAPAPITPEPAPAPKETKK